MSEDLQRRNKNFEENEKIHLLSTANKNCWEYIFEVINIKGISKAHFCTLTELGEENYRKAEKGLKNDPTVRTIVAIGVGLSLDIETVDKMLYLAGRNFKDTPEDRSSALPVSPGILYQTAMISLLPEDTKLLAQNNVYSTFSRYSITGICGFFLFQKYFRLGES